MTNKPLAEHIVYEMSEPHIEKMWGQIAQQVPAARRSAGRRTASYLGGFAVAAGVLLGWYFGSPLHGGSENPSVATAQAPLADKDATLKTSSDRMAVDLSDGSHVTVSPHSHVAVQKAGEHRVALSLKEGRVDCDVAKDKERTFAVMAGPVTVRVIGTKFSVERQPANAGETIGVSVERGIVEVDSPKGTRRLSAGESWSVRIPHQAEPTQAVDSQKHATAQEGSAQAAASVRDVSEDAAKPADRRTASQTAAKKESAKDLFERARAQRNAGEASQAAQLYAQFLATYPRDGRGGVAALELGRLRMDHLGDIRGAIAPLQRAARGGAGGLGDDALARLARVHSMLGQKGACQSVRSRYLKSYPQGVHVESVRNLCP